jgi:hypothetical protein
MYYTDKCCSSAILALCQFERLLLEDLPPQAKGQYVMQLQGCIWQFENAVDNIAKHIDELMRLGLAQYLPVSIGAYTALPLVLHLLDVRLAPQNSPTALKKRRLGVFLELFRIYEPRFLEIEYLWQTLRIVIDFLEIECPSNRQKFLQQSAHQEVSEGIFTDATRIVSSSILSKRTGSNIAPSRDWREIFSTKPHQYMPMALLLDLTLAQNRVPSRGDVFARLPKNSYLARLFPSPSHGAGLGNTMPMMQIEMSQTQVEEEEEEEEEAEAKIDDTKTSQEEAGEETDSFTDNFEWDAFEDQDALPSPTAIESLLDSIQT